jgi:hypothetical protein
VRTLEYLDIDAMTTELAYEGGYVRLKDVQATGGRAIRLAIPARRGALIHGVQFVANRVLHSGADGEHGHYVAAYGAEQVLRNDRIG